MLSRTPRSSPANSVEASPPAVGAETTGVWGAAAGTVAEATAADQDEAGLCDALVSGLLMITRGHGA